jgi:hypothetical protein
MQGGRLIMPIMLERQIPCWRRTEHLAPATPDNMNHALSDDRPRSFPGRCISLPTEKRVATRKGLVAKP